ncbi:MAG: S9 family peptidase [Williamsia sp.]|nr:S9 family peptidase [Williamsia sp.]
MRKRFYACFLSACMLGAVYQLPAQDDNSYKTPPKEIEELVLAKPTPGVSLDSKANWMILMERSSFPGVDELAEPELRIAGLRIDPNNFGPSRGSHITGLQIKNIQTKELSAIKDLPKNLRAGILQWSPDETQFAFTNTEADRIDLYRVNIAEKKAYKVNTTPLNAVLGNFGIFSWLDNHTILYRGVVNGLQQLPPKPLAPKGPNIQESKGKQGASRTYEDLIRTAYDETLFEFYATSQLIKNDFTKETKIGIPAIYSRISASPDKNYLLVSKINKPFSYLVPANGFPTTIEVLTVNGESKKVLATNPSSEGNPIGFDDVPAYARNYSWREDEPATLTYIQALDKGLGRTKAPYRDALYAVSLEGNATPKELFKTTMRLRNIEWGNNQLALVYEGMTATRRTRINTFNPSTGALDSLFERSTNDAYSDIGRPVTVKNSFGKDVLFTSAGNTQLLLTSQGSSPEGDMPFIQSYSIKERKGKILWRCQAPFYETIEDVIDPEKLIFVTVRQSQTEVPNYYIRDLRKKSLAGTPITNFTNPYALLEGVKKQKISYKRADGIDLTADLYLPKNYDAAKEGPLPVIIWAYPREYKSAADAAQVRGSKYMFTRINYGSPIFWVTQGYAVMDNAEMPIVGEGSQEPNDNFIPQLYLNAHAAIQAVAKMGVGDSDRVAVGGHSYGAFMTANLLAHTKLFKAGIARSGAYNRTLTPFGFQAEERTYWQAPDVYYKMSPFSYADSIKTPLLMIHGEADDNPGTFPIQSERLFNAVKGHGGTVRLVYLPFEAHGYAGKENILHMLWEQNNWLEKYVKNAKGTINSEPQGKKAF